MKNILKINNAVFYAYHGVMSEEQMVGRKFEVDAELYFNFNKAYETDKLNSTVNYVEVYKFIQDFFTNNKFFLIERISVKIAEKLLEKFPLLERVKIEVRKCHPPVGGLIDSVEAVTELSRNE